MMQQDRTGITQLDEQNVANQASMVLRNPLPNAIHEFLAAGLPSLSDWAVPSVEAREAIQSRLSSLKSDNIQILPLALRMDSHESLAYQLDSGALAKIDSRSGAKIAEYCSLSDFISREIIPTVVERVTNNEWGSNFSVLCGLDPLADEIPEVVSLERTLVGVLKDPRYLKAIEWGEPRDGHPEGNISAHIDALRLSIGLVRDMLSDHDLIKLLIVAHLHDTFKGEAVPKVPIIDPRSHASIAAQYAQSVGLDSDLCGMIQNHDVPVAIFRGLKPGKDYSGRLRELFSSVKDPSLLLAFVTIDGLTEGKSPEPLNWFIDEARAMGVDTRLAERIRLRVCTLADKL